MKSRAISIVLAVVLFCAFASAQWLQRNTPSTGNVRGIVVSGGDLFAGVYNGGVFRSTDDGMSWTPVMTGLTTTLVYAIDVAPANDGSGKMNLFVATNGHGIFRSSDRGETWTAVNTGLTRWTILDLAVCPDEAGGATIFAGSVDMGVYRSTDNGANWTQVNNGFPDWNSKNILSLSAVNTDVYACTYVGLFRSTDGGDSWTQVNVKETKNQYLAFAVHGTDQFVSIGGEGIFRSTDNGVSWSALSSGLTSTSIRAFAASGVNFFAGTPTGVFLLNDDGTGWLEVNEGLCSSAVYSFAHRPGAGGWGGSDLFAGTGNGGVCLMNNSDLRWTTVKTGLPNACIQTLAAHGSDLFAGTDGGKVYLSTDNGTSWTEASGGLTVGSVLSLAVSPTTDGVNLFASTKGDGVFLSTDRGASWTAVNTGLTRWYIPDLAVCPDGSGGTNIFAGTIDMGVFRSTDNGTSWTQVNAGFPNWDSRCINSLTAVGTSLYACTWGGLFVSTNSGDSWAQLNVIETGNRYLSLMAFGTNLYVGIKGDGVFRSTNNGASWTAANSGLTNTTVGSFAVSGGYLFGGTNSGAFLSTDDGTSWTSLSLGLISKSIYSLITTEAFAFVGTGGGGVYRLAVPEVPLPISLQSFSAVLLSPADGVRIEWSTVSEIDNFGFLVEKSAAGPEFAFAPIPGSFTPGQGTTQVPHAYSFVDKSVSPGKWAYRLKQFDLDGTVHLLEPTVIEIATTGLDEKPAVPTVTSLDQNYPNPFNPTTTIWYSVGEPGSRQQAVGNRVVRLAVYDLLGREVAVLVDGERQPGEYTATWDARGVASGVYICRLQAGDFTQTRTMSLVR